MNFLKTHFENVIKYDLINKFNYKSLKQIPYLKKIVLNIDCNSNSLVSPVSALVALNLITAQKAVPVRAKDSIISLNIRKGNPVGCKVTLRNIKMYNFFFNVLHQVLTNMKYFEGFYLKKKSSTLKTVDFTISDVFKFKQLEEHYYVFKDLSPLKVSIVTNSNNLNEFIFLLKSFKLPVS